MVQLYNPEYIRVDQLFVTEMFFEKDSGCQDVTLTGLINYQQGTREVTLSCSFALLVSLMDDAGDAGAKILEAISLKLQSAEEEFPVVVRVGQYDRDGIIELAADHLQLYKPMHLCADGVWRADAEDEFYLVEWVEE